MAVYVDLQIATTTGTLPSSEQFQQWADAALAGRANEAELTIRIVDNDESHALNLQYRSKDKATNVLSFPFTPPPGVELNLLGDLVVCAEIVNNEAQQQHKAIVAHWAHMVIHGCLHLLGFDHITNKQAEEMERLEVDILLGLGYDNPYAEYD